MPQLVCAAASMIWKTIAREHSDIVVSDLSAVNRKGLEKEGLILSLHQIRWWDEKHIPQVVGEVLDEKYQFGNDENGILK